MNNQGFDRNKARELIQTFPTLIILFKSGLLTRKLVRDALSIEKWMTSISTWYARALLESFLRTLSEDRPK